MAGPPCGQARLAPWGLRNTSRGPAIPAIATEALSMRGLRMICNVLFLCLLMPGLFVDLFTKAWLNPPYMPDTVLCAGLSSYSVMSRNVSPKKVCSRSNPLNVNLFGNRYNQRSGDAETDTPGEYRVMTEAENGGMQP